MTIRYLENIINSGLFQYIRKSDYISAFEQLNIVSRSFRKGEFIIRQGEIVDSICIVETGSVRGEKTYPSGDVYLASVFDEGMIFSLEVAVSKRKTTPMDIIANEHCRILYVSMHSIEQSPFQDRLRLALIEMLADDNIRMSNKIEILAERGLRDRIMVYLNILSKKSGTDEVQVRMSREQMAQYLCVNRSSLSNELNKMKQEGLIDFQKGKFTILNQREKFE